MLILGLNMFHADASAAILQDGKILFAIAEERLNRIKHYAGFPALAVKACLDAAGVKISDIEHVAVGQDPDANLAKKAAYAVSHPENVLNFIQLRNRKKRMRDVRLLLAESLEVPVETLRFQEHHIEHHLAHIASAYFCSPWERAAGYSYDGSGDFVSAMAAKCEGNQIQVLGRVFLPHSLGSFYTMICEFIGYKHYGDEGKVMGLAPYGTSSLYERVAPIVGSREGGYELDLRFFQPLGTNQGMQIKPDGTVSLAPHFSSQMQKEFGAPRKPFTEFLQRDKDLAFAMQRRFEEVFLTSLNHLHVGVPIDNLALAGGCALNSVANGKIFDDTPFRKTWIQPAAGDEGLAVGAALYVNHSILNNLNRCELTHAYLGSNFSVERVQSALREANVEYRLLPPERLLEEAAALLADGKIVGWHQGRMEWGPRALGNRSILAHPGLPDMKDRLNARIKQREWFRPFAPSILAERQAEYFEHDHPSPFMLHVYKIRPGKRSELCAVNHVDDTGRLQTVTREANPLYYSLIEAFERKTGIPVLLNTSFNENEPIVNTPEEAIACFLRTQMDALAIGPCIAIKSGRAEMKRPN